MSEDAQKKEAEIVAVPLAVFQQVMEQLAAQPYKDVGALLNVLITYKPQMVQVE